MKSWLLSANLRTAMNNDTPRIFYHFISKLDLDLGNKNAYAKVYFINDWPKYMALISAHSCIFEFIGFKFSLQCLAD